MRIPAAARFVFLCAVLLLGGQAASGDGASLFNTEIYQSPWEGETPGKGTFLVRHEGQGEPPKEGYFKQHEPG